MKNNLQNSKVAGKQNMGFYPWELTRFQRISDVFNEDIQCQKTNQLDFVKFVDEHDKRRGTDFTKTFPDLVEFYIDIKSRH